MTQSFYSHGKLLLTGEYVVLDGATALAIPTKKGQKLEVSTITEKQLQWRSYLEDDSTWIDVTFSLPLKPLTQTNDATVARLYDILIALEALRPALFTQGYRIENRLEFNRSWGLGSSSTLINNLAQWAQVDPFVLLEKTFGGSGYDIACAKASTPILYTHTKEKISWETTTVHWPFTEELFFVYLNKKQNSRESIKHYRNSKPENLIPTINKISSITTAFIKCRKIESFEELIIEHEYLISKLIKTRTIKQQLFPDYGRVIKSLGGWGGDFVLVAGTTTDMDYFKKRGYTTIIPFKEMIL